MRQIGTLTTSDDAQRFTAYLVTQDIPAQADADGDVFLIWVKNEDQVPQAKAALDHFRQSPQDALYQGVTARAAAKVREEQQSRLKARENVVDISRKWQTGGQRIGMQQAPFTYALIGLSILVALLTFGQSPRNSVQRYLSFSSPRSYDPVRDIVTGPPIDANGRVDGLYDIRHGQLWRLVTPIFLHGGIFHIVFNLLMLHMFGRRVEVSIGTWRMALLVLAIAIASNLAQYFWKGPNFVGISGVVYGLFGYMWVKSSFFPDSTLYLNGQVVVIMIGFMFGCIAAELMPTNELLAGLFGDTANAAHVMGLLSGMAISAAPLWLRAS